MRPSDLRSLLAALLLLAAGGPAAGAEEPSWLVYLNANDIRALATRDGKIYAGTGGGIFGFDLARGAVEQHHRERDGLLSDSLSSLAVAPDGRLWCGTETAGISIFDPSDGSWESFTSLLRPIPGDRIRTLRFQSDTLLVGTSDGLAVFVDGEQRVVCKEGVDLCGLPSFDVLDMAAGPDGVWAATEEGVARRGPEGEWTVYAGGVGDPAARRIVRYAGEWVASFDEGVRALRSGAWEELAPGLAAQPGIVDLLVDGAALLAAGAQGIWRLDPGGAWQRVGSRSFNASCVVRGEDGTLWAGGRDAAETLDGLWRLDGSTWVRTAIPGPSSRAHYLALAFDSDRVLHAATAQRGVQPMYQTFDGAVWSAPRTLDDWTFDLEFDPSGDLWFAQCCCRENGCDLDRLSAGAFDSEPPRNLRDLAYDDEGNLWGASDQAPDAVQFAEGIWMRTPGGEWSQFRSDTAGSQMLSNRVRSLAPSGRILWLGYTDGGVHRWDLGADRIPLSADDTWFLYSTETVGRRLISDAITRIVAEGSRIWVGTTGGLSLIDPGRVTNIGTGFDRLPTPQVNAILPVSDGGAWVATAQGGIVRMTPDGSEFSFTRYGPPDLPHPNAEVLLLDPDGRSVWAGTSRGLARLTPSAGGGGNEAELIAYPNPYTLGCGSLRLLGFSGLADGAIVDYSGKTIARFDLRAPGSSIWDGRDSSGRLAAPGLYWVRASTPSGIRMAGVGAIDGPCPQ